MKFRYVWIVFIIVLNIFVLYEVLSTLSHLERRLVTKNLTINDRISDGFKNCYIASINSNGTVIGISSGWGNYRYVSINMKQLPFTICGVAIHNISDKYIVAQYSEVVVPIWLFPSIIVVMLVVLFSLIIFSYSSGFMDYSYSKDNGLLLGILQIGLLFLFFIDMMCIGYVVYVIGG